MGFLIYTGLQNAQPTRNQILGACLHPAAAFTFGTLAFTEWEGNGWGGGVGGCVGGCICGVIIRVSVYLKLIVCVLVCVVSV